MEIFGRKVQRHRVTYIAFLKQNDNPVETLSFIVEKVLLECNAYSFL